jgi:hypothetical protein
MVKSELVTLSVTVAVCVSDPLVPLMVRTGLPAGVEADVVTVMVDVPEPVTEAGLKDAVAPAGKPVALRATTPVKPFCAPIVAV